MNGLETLEDNPRCRHRGVQKTLKMYIIIATPGEDDGRRRGKLEVTKRGPPSLNLASSYTGIILSHHTIHSRG